jgi:hypothetical protein
VGRRRRRKIRASTASRRRISVRGYCSSWVSKSPSTASSASGQEVFAGEAGLEVLDLVLDPGDVLLAGREGVSTVYSGWRVCGRCR